MKERVKELCKKKGVSMNLAESEIGLAKGYISKLDKSNPNIKTLQKIADYFGVSVDYFSSENVSSATGKQKGTHIPVFDRVAAGIPIEMITDIVDQEEITEELAKRGQYFGLRIKGKSMETRIWDGDVVIVRQQDDAESGEIVIATVNGSDATCKRLKKYADGIWLMPLNPNYEPMNYTTEEIINKPVRILGKVVEVRGKLE